MQEMNSLEYRMVEKKNHLAVHAVFSSQSGGERFLKDVVPNYIKRGLYSDKTLTVDDFEIVSAPKTDRW